MSKPLRVLVIEDSEADFDLLVRHLGRHGLDAECRRIASDDALAAALGEPWDLVLSDYQVPGMSFRPTLHRIQASRPELPVILVSGKVGEETAVELLLQGVADFVIKDHLSRLLPAIRRALDDARERAARRQAETALRESEEHLRTLVATILDSLLLTTADGRILATNEAACRLFGRTEDELIAAGLASLVDPADPRLAAAMAELARSGRFHGELTLRRGDGSRFESELSAATFHDRDATAHTSMVIRDITERKRAEDSLRQSKEQMQALTARLQAVREEERTRIAREVHDVLGQLLTGLTMDMAWLERRLHKLADAELRQAMTDKLAETRELTDTMIQTVQEIASEMRPSVLDNLGLSSAIRFEASRFQKRTGIDCQVRTPQTPPALGPAHTTGVFRVFQEILTNVARHAEASQVVIQVTDTPDKLTLLVHDNGRGITPEQLADVNSLGLLGMRERAAQLGGEIAFAGAAGAGTTVMVTMPK